MNKQTKTGQKKHDSAVLKTAQWYENNGYKVKADLPDYNKPKKIGGFIPDLIVKKAKIEKFSNQLHKHGDWFAFFSFLPGIGDIIAVASGFFRCRWYIVALSMLLGKFVRYIVWMYFNGLFM